MVLLKIVSGFSGRHLTHQACLGIVKDVTLWKYYILVNSSEISESILTKLWYYGPWIVFFKSYVRFCRTPSKMAAMPQHNLALDPMGFFIINKSSETLWPI